MDHQTCPTCPFDGESISDADLLERLRGLGRRWSALLADAGEELRLRPADGVWSAIEYAAHSRDITALHVFGVEQAAEGDEPTFPAIQAEELIESAVSSYEAADSNDVARDLGRQAVRLADVAESAGPAAWHHGITIGDERSNIRFLLEHSLHDSEHHLLDVTRGLDSLRAG